MMYTDNQQMAQNEGRPWPAAGEGQDPVALIADQALGPYPRVHRASSFYTDFKTKRQNISLDFLYSRQSSKFNRKTIIIYFINLKEIGVHRGIMICCGHKV